MGIFNKLKNVVTEAVDTVSEIANQKPSDRLVMVNDDNQLMKDAIKQAKETLTDYLLFFKDAPLNTSNHRVKALFSDANGDEHIWLVNISHNGNSISGQVGNTPGVVSCVSDGEKVSVPLEQITDWAFEAEGLQYGNYTVYALFENMDPAEVEQYVEGYGFTQNPLETPNASFDELIMDLPEPTGEDIENAVGNLLSVEAKLDEELQKRIAEFFEGENPDEEELNNAILDEARHMYNELEGSKYEAGAKLLLEKYEQKFLVVLGISDADKVAATVDENEEYFGITLFDFAAASAKFQAGVPYEIVLEVLGVSGSDYEAGTEKWAERMGSDTTYQVSKQYADYLAVANDHPKLGGL